MICLPEKPPCAGHRPGAQEGARGICEGRDARDAVLPFLSLIILVVALFLRPVMESKDFLLSAKNRQRK